MANSVSSFLSPYIVGEAIEALGGTTELLKSTNNDFSTAQMKKGKTVSMGVPQVLVATTKTAANTAPAPAATTTGSRNVTLSNEYKTSFSLAGADDQNYDLTSADKQQLREAVIGMAYKINSTVWANYTQIPYYVGNSGTGFFASNAKGLSAMDKVLTGNFCPINDRKYICGLDDYADLIDLTEVHYQNQFGGNVAQTGVVVDVRGFMVNRDQQVPTHTIGTITTGLITKAATVQAIGTTDLICTTAASTGALSFKDGDIVLIDGVNYAVQGDTVQAAAATDVTVTLDRGLETAMAGSEAVIFSTSPGTFDANSLVGIGGKMDGFSVLGRMPQTVVNGIAMQGDHYPIVDPVSGFPFLLSLYPQYGQVSVEVSAIWGTEVTDSRKLCRSLSTS